MRFFVASIFFTTLGILFVFFHMSLNKGYDQKLTVFVKTINQFDAQKEKSDFVYKENSVK